MSSLVAYGPIEARVRWVEDTESPDPGDCDPDEFFASAEQYGVFGCVIETRGPACPCCGAHEWQPAESLWSIIGPDDYHREVERELLAEVAATR